MRQLITDAVFRSQGFRTIHFLQNIEGPNPRFGSEHFQKTLYNAFLFRAVTDLDLDLHQGCNICMAVLEGSMYNV